LGRDLADATQAIAEAVQDIGQGPGRWDRPIGSGRVGDQLLVNGCGRDSGIAEWGVELRVGLRVRFHQGVDLLQQFGVVIFGLVSSAGAKVVETTHAGAKFAQTGGDGVATPAKDLLSASRLSVAILKGHFGLKLPAAKASQFAGGSEDDILHRR
jgi:hypothetical protein